VEDRLRICLVALMFAPIVGGAEVRAEKQARQLRALGHDVTIVTLRHEKHWKKQEVIDGLPIIRVGGIYRLCGTLRIGRLAHIPVDILMFLTLWRLRHQYDILHSAQLSTLAGVVALVGKLTGKPVIISIPSSGPVRKQQPEDAVLMADTLAEKLSDTSFLKVPFRDILAGGIGNFYRTALGGKAIVNYLKKSEAFYQTLSSRSSKYLISLGFRPEKIVRIPNGVDIERYRPALELQPDPAKPERDILCVARLQFPKGLDVLLHAWYRMMREPAEWRANLNPRLFIVGIGPLQEQLERIAAELGIQDSVVFLGLRKDKEVIPLLQKSWGFILPSRWEGMPNALLEAMACGTPSIATRVSGSEDIIVDGVNGLLVDPEEPEQMAQALHRLIGDTAMAQQMAQEGRATILRDYQLSCVIERCVEMYHRALAENHPVGSLALKETGD